MATPIECLSPTLLFSCINRFYLIPLVCSNLLLASDYTLTFIPGSFRTELSFSGGAIKEFTNAYHETSETFEGTFAEGIIPCQKCESSRAPNSPPVPHFFSSTKTCIGSNPPSYENSLQRIKGDTPLGPITALCARNTQEEQFNIVRDTFRKRYIAALAYFMNKWINIESIKRSDTEIRQYSGIFHHDRKFIATYRSSSNEYETVLVPLGRKNTGTSFVTNDGNLTKEQFDIVRTEYERRSRSTVEEKLH